jgi:hypothetical protein
MNVRISQGISALAAGLFLLAGSVSAQVRVSAVAPATVQPGRTFVATGTAFPAGTVAGNVTARFTPVTVGAGPTVDAPLVSLAAVVGTTMRATVAIPAALIVTAPTPYRVTFSSIVAPTFTTTTPGNITVNPAPSLTSVSPITIRRTRTVNVTVLGSFSNFAQGVSTVNFGPDITINSVSVSNLTTLNANVTVGAGAALGVRNIGVTTGGEALTLANALTIESAPLVLSAIPNGGVTGSSTNVTLQGIGTTWLTGIGTLGASFGPGITVNSIVASSDSAAVANVSIAGGAAIGARDITVNKGTETATGTGLFSVSNPPALLTSVTPNTGQQGQNGLNVNLTGQGTQWLQGTTVANFGAGVTVVSLTVNSPNTATAVLNVGLAATPGVRNVSMTTGAEVATMNNGFSVTNGTPLLTGVAPPFGSQGATLNVTLSGQSTNWTQGVTTVSFGAGVTINSVTVNSTTSAVASITIDPLAAVGTRNVSVTTGPEVVSLNNAFLLNPGAATISNVAPNAGTQGQTLSVNVTGTGTHFAQGTTSVSFGTGIVVNSITVSSPTALAANITINAAAAGGIRVVSATTGGEVATLVSGFNVQTGTPTLLSVTPNSGAQQASTSVALVGDFTHWGPGTTVSFGPGINVSALTFISPTSLTATIQIDPLANLGGRTVTVTAGPEVVSLPNAYTVTPGPAVLGVTPNAGQQGQTISVTITGTATHFAQGTSTVNFGPGINVGGVTVNSPTSITLNLSIDPTAVVGGRTVQVVTGGEVAIIPNGFTVNAGTPVLTSIAPAGGVQGQTIANVALNGAFTHWAQGTTTATFGTGITVNSLTINSATSATASITIDALTTVGLRNVTMTTGGEIVNLNGSFAVSAGPATISNIAPTSGLQGQNLTVTINGSGTHFAQGTTTASFGVDVIVASLTVNSATQAVAQLSIPPGAILGPRTVLLSTGGENVALPNSFTVNAGTPVITSITPASGIQSQANLNVNLVGAFTHFLNGSTTANFGANVTVNSVTVTDATHATVNITILGTANTGGRSVSLTTGGETVNALFTVSSGTATISSVTPNSGQQGQSRTVNIVGQGTNFSQTNSVFSLGLGITVTSLTVVDINHATAEIAIAPATVVGSRTAVMVTGGEVVSLNDAFTVTAATPVITSITPNSLAQGLTGNVNIAGQFTNFSATSVPTFGQGVVVNSVTFNSATSLTVNLTVSPTANVAANNVTVITGPEIVTSNAAFLVTPGAATLLSLTPNASSQGANNVSIAIVGQGTHFAQASTVANFGSGITVNSLTVTDATHATAVISISELAAIGVRTATLTTLGEVASLGNGFTVNAATPVLTSVTPSTGQQQQSLNVNILGNFTHFVQGTTVASFGAGITVNSLTVNNATSATAAITISPTADILHVVNVGLRNVTLTTGAEVVTLASGFRILAGPAVISSLTPNNADQGAANLSVNIVGTNTNFAAGTTTVNFGPSITVHSVNVVDATHLTAVISIAPGATTGLRGVSATTGGELAVINNGFTVNAATPVIISATPTSGAQGTTLNVAIVGLFTNFVQGTSVATFGNGITINSTTVTDATHASANITIDPLAVANNRNVTVITGPEVAVGANRFLITPGTAAISSLTPNSGTQGQNGLSVAIVGSNSHFTNGFTTANFGPGITVDTLTLTDATHATAVITIAPNATVGPHTVSISTQGEQIALANAFTVIAATPVLTSVNPNVGRQGETLATVAIVGQFTNFVQGTTTLDFGPGIVINSITVADATHLTANVFIDHTAARTTRNVTAFTGAETAVRNSAFTVQAGNAAISSVTPNGGQQGVNGLAVAIVGSGTHFVQGVTAANFGGSITVTSLTVVDATHANAVLNISPAAALGPVAVTLTTGGESAFLNNAFAVTTGSATLSSISPTSGRQGAAPFNMSVVGNFTTFVQGSTTASIGTGITINSVTVTDATHATLNVTVAPNAAPGLYSVTMTTGVQVATLTNSFTVQPGIPTLSSITPNQGSQGAMLTVQLNGAFTSFTPGVTTASFGTGITAGLVTVVNATTATVPITIAAGTTAGPRSVTVTTGTEVVTLNSGFNVQPGTPSITIVSPNYGLPNSTVTVNLTGQFTNWVNGTTLASFGPNVAVGGGAAGAPGPITVTSPTTATASLNISAGATLQPQNIVVTTGGEILQVINGFTVQNSSTTPPTVISFNPSSTNVPLNAVVTVQWSQPMDRTRFTSTNFYLYDIRTGLNVPATNAVDASGRITSITPTQLLAVNRTYYFYVNPVAGTGIQDALGNRPQFSFIGQFTTGFDSANSGPSFLSSSIAPAATNVALNSPIALRFSSQINPTSRPAGIQITTGGNQVNGNYVFDPAGSLLTFTPTAPLAASTVYTVAYTADLTDPAGNPLTNPGTFSFTTGTAADTSGPGILSYSPPANETGVATNTLMRIVFSEPLDATTVIESNAYLYNANNTALRYPVTLNLAADRRSLIITPVAPLLNFTQYLWQFYSYKGSNGVTGSTHSQYFTTGGAADNTAPTLISVSPANGATNVPVNANISAVFSEGIDPTSVSDATFTVSLGATGAFTITDNRITLNPTANLATSTLYTVTINGLRDYTGNVIGAVNSTFTTSASATNDVTGPSVTSFVPANNATNVALNSTVTYNINEPIDPTSVRTNEGNADTIAVFVTPSGGSATEWPGTLSVTNAATTSQIVFTPTAPFPPNASIRAYFVYNAYPTDLAGNNGNSTSAIFTTVAGTDTTAPVITSITPPNGANAVGQNTPVIITFNKPLNPSTVNASFFRLFNGTVPLSTSVSRSDDSRTITLTASLPTDTDIHVVVTSGVTDLLGNHAVDFSSVFHSAPIPPSSRPSVVTQRPGNGATNVDPTTPITLVVNAPMNGATIPGALKIAQNGVLVPGATQLSVNGGSILFTPTAPFTHGALIEVYLQDTATDTHGNKVNAYSGQFTIRADQSSAAPTVTSLSPTHGATILLLNPVIDIRFSQPLDPTTVNTSTVFVRQNDTIAVNGTVSLLDANTIRFIPNPRNLSAVGQPYYRINLTNGIKGANGVNFAGSLNNYYFYMDDAATLIDNVGPTVTGLAPTDGSTVGDNVIFRATFSEAINPLTVNSNTFRISGGGFTAMPSSISFDTTNRQVTITPQTPMPNNANLTITINGIQDPSGNPVTPFVSNFTTSNGPDTTRPEVITNITSGAVDVPINTTIVAQFSEPIDFRTISSSSFYLYDTTTGDTFDATYSTSPDGRNVTMIPTAPLPVGRLIYLYVNTNIADMAGNANTNYFAQFTTAFAPNTTPPTVIETAPMSGAVGVPINSATQVLFSEPISETALTNVRLLLGNSSGVPQPITRDLAGSLLTLRPSNLLLPSTQYTLSIANVVDTAGNVMTTPVNRSFTTGPGADLIAPTVTSINPFANQTDVPTNAVLRVTFSEPINPLSLTTFRLYNYAQGRYLPATITVAPNGLSATLIPASPLPPQDFFQLSVGSYTDRAGNLGGGANTNFTTGSSTNASSPTIISVNPPNGATNVGINAKISARMSAIIDETTVSNASFNLVPPVAGTVTLGADNRTVTFTPTAPLSPSTLYLLVVGGFADTAGNIVVASATSFLTGAAADAVKPLRTTSFPTSGATGVALNIGIAVNFNEQLDPNSLIYNVPNGNSFQVFANVPSIGQYAVPGVAVLTNIPASNTSTIVFTPSAPLPASATITVYSTYNVPLADFAGNTLNQSSFSFTTAAAVDPTAPTVTSVSPANGAIGVGPYADIVLRFSEPLNPTTISNSFALYNGGTLNTTSATYSADFQTVTLNVGALPGNTLFTVVATSNARDYAGNALVPFTSTFTTAPIPNGTRPSITSQRPANGATQVAPNVKIYIVSNEPLNPATVPGAVHVSVDGVQVNGTVALNPAGTSIIFTPTLPFPASSLVHVYVDDVATDLDGNLINTYTGSFTVRADQTGVAPTLVSLNPPHGADNQPLNTVLEIQFSKNLDPTTVNTTNVFLRQNDTTVVLATVTLPFPNVIRITPNAAFAAADNYYRLTILNNAVRDTDGNAFAGTTGSYYFYTRAATSIVDASAPTILGLAPPNGATNVGDNAVIQIHFSEAVNPLSVNATSISITGGATTVTPSITFSNSGKTVTLTPQSPLPNNTLMTVAISGVRDSAGNSVTPQNTTFTTGPGTDTTAPSVIQTSFTNGASNIPLNTVFAFRFSEPMDTVSLSLENGFRLYNASTGVDIPANRTFSSDRTLAFINATSPLPANTPVYIYISNARDLTGNVLSTSYSTTTSAVADLIAPTITSVNPSGSVAPPTNTLVQVRFDKIVAETSLAQVTLTSGATTIPVTHSLNTGDRIVTLTPNGILQPFTSYTLNVAGVTSLSGIAMTPASFNFTTGAGANLTTATATSVPANGATGVAATVAPTITFSNPINPTLAPENIRLIVHNTGIEVPTTLSFSADYRTVTLTPTAPLTSGTVYRIVTGSMQDQTGRATNGLGNTFTVQ